MYYQYDNTTEIDNYIEQLRKCEYISEESVKNLCNKAAEILAADDNVIYLNSPITVYII
jgi:serine/threonine-protein phosphatase 4 catalytic subunit